MNSINFYYFTFSTYILIIGIAFIVAFMVFYNLSQKYYNKIDIIYVYVINILGFAIGAKILSLLSNNVEISMYNFINSGYSFIGGVIGSILTIILYCKIYKLNLKNILSNFTVIYPLIYSISKIGCFLNNCCYGSISINNVSYNFSLQLIDSAIMFALFLNLMKRSKQQNELITFQFFSMFGIIRFIEDFFRYSRNVMILNLTLEQIVCIIFIIIGTSIFIKNRINNTHSGYRKMGLDNK